MGFGKAKIMSLQALRTWAFLGIFLTHATAPINWPNLGVSTFFVLSGFLTYYQEDGKIMKCGIRSSVIFSWKKIKKLYPLHLITMLAAIALCMIKNYHKPQTLIDLFSLLSSIVLNVTLLQTWVPNSAVNVSLNGVAWYLSVSMFLYCMFPYIFRWLNNKRKTMVIAFCAFLLGLEIILCIPWIYCFGMVHPITIWFIYFFPVFRLGDFFTGCCLGYIVCRADSIRKKNCSVINVTIIEFIVLFVTVFIHKWIKQEKTSIVLLAISNYTTLYIPLAVLWLLIFYYNKGVLSKLLANKAMIRLGNITPYMFLIHYVVTQYCYELRCRYGFNYGFVGYVFELFLTIIISQIYASCFRKITIKIHEHGITKRDDVLEKTNQE